MSDLINLFFGEELFSQLSPDVQASVVIVLLFLMTWCVVRIFSAIGEFF